MLVCRNLGNNVFPTLPIRGLAGLLHLKTFNNPALREFPSPERFPRVQTMLLSYAYHCCSFLSVEMEEPVTKTSLRESILFPTDDFDSSLWNSTFSDIWPHLSEYITPSVSLTHPCILVAYASRLSALNCCKACPLRARSFLQVSQCIFEKVKHLTICFRIIAFTRHRRSLRHWSDKRFLDNLTDKFGKQINELWANFGSDFTYPGNLPSYVEDYFEDVDDRVAPTTRTVPSRIQCLPQPGNGQMIPVYNAS